MRTRLLFAAVLGCLLASCSTPKAPRMVILGLDGLGQVYLTDSLQIPVMRGLMEHGSYTLHKRSVLPSASAINWASIFNGLPTELHGYTRWNSERPDLPCPYVAPDGSIPTLFSLYRQQRPRARIAGLFEWEGVKHCVDTLAFDSWQPMATDTLDNARTTRAVIDCLTKEEDRPDLLFVHFDSPDHTGHAVGYGTPEYAAKIEEMDSLIGRILDACKAAGIYEETVFVIVSDHGGIHKKHGKATLEEMEAPFIVCGPGIREGNALDGLVMQYDVAATLAAILGLETPGYWRGRALPVLESVDWVRVYRQKNQ